MGAVTVTVYVSGRPDAPPAEIVGVLTVYGCPNFAWSGSGSGLLVVTDGGGEFDGHTVPPGGVTGATALPIPLPAVVVGLADPAGVVLQAASMAADAAVEMMTVRSFMMQSRC
jgi:hypothetical protein